MEREIGEDRRAREDKREEEIERLREKQVKR